MLRFDPRKEGIERWLGSLEAAIMDVVWDAAGAVTVKSVWRPLYDERKLAYTTVMTTMQRLCKKRLLTRERVGLSYHYKSVDADADSFMRRQTVYVVRSLESSS